jgi:cardiolipin synthase
MTLPLRQIPNVLTFLRIILVLPFASSLYFGYFSQALVLFFIAGLSDVIDGFIARRFNWKSRFGAIADPLADKLLLVTAYGVLTLVGKLPLWLTVTVFFRDIIIVLGALYYHYFVGTYEMKPSILGKLNTFIQIIYVLIIVVVLADYHMPYWIVFYGKYLVAFFALVSLVHYVALWGKKGRLELKNKKHKVS